MANICDNCGKGSMSAAKHRHRRGVASHKFEYRAPVTKRLLKPNLHVANILVAGTKTKMLLCTKCLRRLKEAQGTSLPKAAAPLG
jgi:ribosomal protein L28